MGYINPYYWVDDHPLTQGTNGSLDPSTNENHLKTHKNTGRGAHCDISGANVATPTSWLASAPAKGSDRQRLDDGRNHQSVTPPKFNSKDNWVYP